MKIRTIFIVSSLTVASMLSNASASEVFGKIIKIKGEGFISQNGKTKAIKAGDFIYANSEIVVEHVGQLSFSTSDDQVYHLGKSSSMMIAPKNMILRTGEVWFQALNKSSFTKISTANADVELSGGEGILVYDSLKAKSQLVVVNGVMKINNSRAPEVAISVAEGNFSYVDNTYDNGIPRDPTPVGEKTYMELISHFPGVQSLDKNSAVAFSKKTHEKEATHEVVHNNSQKHVATEKADDILEAYRDILISTSHTHQNKKVSRGVASAHDVGHATKKDSKPSGTPFKIFGESSKKTMTFGEEFKAPSSVMKNTLRGPASFSAPEFIDNKVGDTKVLEEHDRETKKLIQELGNL